MKNLFVLFSTLALLMLAGSHEVIANTFSVDAPGCASASKNIREIHIDAREMTTGHDVHYRPGAAHRGSTGSTSPAVLRGSKGLPTWRQEASADKNIRKNIRVTLYNSDKQPGRSYLIGDGCIRPTWRP